MGIETPLRFFSERREFGSTIFRQEEQCSRPIKPYFCASKILKLNRK